MTFVHPWAVWIGVAAAALPLAVHLLTRPRPVPMPLSTLRLVHEVIHQRSARHRLRDFLVLVLRTAAILLVGMAIARPQLGRRHPAAEDPAGGDAVRVVVLDVSQSMGATERGIAVLERARAAAAGYLRYRPALRANLILAGAAPRPVFQRPSTNFEMLRDVLARSRASPERLDSAKALDLAGGMLAPRSKSDRRRMELVVVSDFQRANWAGADFSRLPEKTEIHLESVAPPLAPPNLAILAVCGRPQSSSTEDLQLTVEVGNYSPAQRTVTVEVDLEQQTFLRLEGTCPARGTTTLVQDVRVGNRGWLTGEARLLGVEDALMSDNVRPLAARTRPKPVYAILTRQSIAQRPSSSHFLECALVPDARQGQPASADLVRIDPTDLDRRALTSATMLFVDHPGSLDGPAISLLAGLVRRGRPILYLACEPADAMNLRRLAEAAGTGLQMPVEFVPAPPGRDDQPRALTAVRRDDPPFRVFGDGLSAVTGPMRFVTNLSSRRLQAGLEEDILATYDDGGAAMTLAASDAGSLAVINADLAASNLVKMPAFVPLVQELVGRMLEGKERQGSFYCGERLVAQLPVETESSEGLRVVRATGSQGQPAAEPLGDLTSEGLGVVWHWPQPAGPAAYRIERSGEPVFALAVESPPEESDLDSLPKAVMEDRMAGGRRLYVHRAAGEDDPRDDLWVWSLAACIACMLGEISVLLAFRN